MVCQFLFQRQYHLTRQQNPESIFFNVGHPKEDIFLTTIYGLCFSHQNIYYKLQPFTWWTSVGSFPFNASTPVFLTCGLSSFLYFCLYVSRVSYIQAPIKAITYTYNTHPGHSLLIFEKVSSGIWTRVSMNVYLNLTHNLDNSATTSWNKIQIVRY